MIVNKQRTAQSHKREPQWVSTEVKTRTTLQLLWLLKTLPQKAQVKLQHRQEGSSGLQHEPKLCLNNIKLQGQEEKTTCTYSFNFFVLFL